MNTGLLLKGITESVQNEIKEQKDGFFSMLLVTLGASLCRVQPQNTTVTEYTMLPRNILRWAIVNSC